MIHDIADAVEIARIEQVAPVVHDGAVLLVALQALHLPGDAVRQQVRPVEFGPDARRCLDVQRQ